jgi:hypothetical protein
MIIGSWIHRPRRTTVDARTLAPVALTSVVGAQDTGWQSASPRS